MRISVVTLFPEMFGSFLQASLLGKAIANQLVTVELVNPRDFTVDRHKTVDDTPYGGGAGMVMRAEPLISSIEEIEIRHGAARKILLTPTGKPFDRTKASELAALDHVMLVCGRYEGMDARVRSAVDEELSIGDYVLSGGEPAAMVVIDAVARRVRGVLGNEASAVDESFESGLLEYPQYTRPAEFRGARVPEALLSGNHERIRRWRRWAALKKTREVRPDLLEKMTLSDEDRALLDGDEP